ncbi:MAG: hypothetical protein ACOX6J_07470 [Oscillospiraceae bacterium]|jgi:hypothetical protein
MENIPVYWKVCILFVLLFLYLVISGKISTKAAEKKKMKTASSLTDLDPLVGHDVVLELKSKPQDSGFPVKGLLREAGEDWFLIESGGNMVLYRTGDLISVRESSDKFDS